MMSHLYFEFGTVIKKGELPVSPLGETLPSGQLSTETIIECDAGEQVYVQVVLSAAHGYVPCALNGISLAGFTGRLDFRY